MTPASSPVVRHFYRCADCLAVMASAEFTERKVDGRYYPTYGTCGGCGGAIEYMGRVQRDRLVKTGYECPCDGRCTGAIGPNCDCKCGGANHGTNRIVEVTRDAGIPVFGAQPAAGKVAEYRALVASVQSSVDLKYGDILRRKRNGEYLSSGEFSRFLDGANLLRSLGAAKGLRSHAARNKRLASLLHEVNGSPA